MSEFKLHQNMFLSFEDIFTSIYPYKEKHFKFGDYCVSGYVLVDGPEYASISAQPSPKAVEFIQNNMLVIENDLIYFKVIILDNGKSRVFTKYNAILGHRYLAGFDEDETTLFWKRVKALQED